MKVVTVRKDHDCLYCDGTIKKGEKAKAQQELRTLLESYPQEKDIAARLKLETA